MAGGDLELLAAGDLFAVTGRRIGKSTPKVDTTHRKVAGTLVLKLMQFACLRKQRLTLKVGEGEFWEQLLRFNRVWHSNDDD